MLYNSLFILLLKFAAISSTVSFYKEKQSEILHSYFTKDAHQIPKNQISIAESLIVYPHIILRN